MSLHVNIFNIPQIYIVNKKEETIGFSAPYKSK